MKFKKTSKNSLQKCGLTAKECKGVGIMIADKPLEKCLTCPIYKKSKRS